MLLQRTVGTGQVAGRVLMTTTPFSDRLSRADVWNVLPGSSEMEPWPFVILANQIMSALVGSGEQQLNYYAGVNTVLLPVSNPNQPRLFVLYPPSGAGIKLPLPHVQAARRPQQQRDRPRRARRPRWPRDLLVADRALCRVLGNRVYRK
jgi:hypothetical protein